MNHGISITMPAFALEDIEPIYPEAEPEHVVNLITITPDIVNMVV